jgi:hypothetical protein
MSMSETTRALVDEIVRISELPYATAEELSALNGEVEGISARLGVDTGLIFDMLRQYRHPLENILEKSRADMRNAFKPDVLLEFVKMEAQRDGTWSVMKKDLRSVGVDMPALRDAMAAKKKEWLADNPPEGDQAWLAELQLSSRGEILGNMLNCKIVLENDPRFSGRFSFDVNQETACILDDGELVPMTDELMEDAPALDSYLRAKAPQKMVSKLNTAIVRGTARLCFRLGWAVLREVSLQGEPHRHRS